MGSIDLGRMAGTRQGQFAVFDATIRAAIGTHLLARVPDVCLITAGSAVMRHSAVCRSGSNAPLVPVFPYPSRAPPARSTAISARLEGTSGTIHTQQCSSVGSELG